MALGDLSADILPTIFGGSTGLTYEQLKRRQAVATALAAQKRPFPKTLGEGIASLGNDIGEIMRERRLMAAEQAYDARRAAAGGMGGGVPPVTPPTLAPRPPGAAAPAGIPPSVGGRFGLGGGAPPAVPAAPGPSAALDTEDQPDNIDRIAAAIVDQQDAGGAANPPLAVGPSGDRAGPNRQISDDAFGSAIAGIETGGRRDPYRTVGVVTDGDRPYGKYQVMGRNIPQWTEAALGQALTPAQFLASPEAQDATFRHRFGQYVAQYGPEGAARAWFAGEGGMNNPNARDRLGTSVGDYGARFVNNLGGRGAGGQQYAALPPNTVTDASENEVTPTDIRPAPPVQLAQAGAGAGAPASGISGPLTPAPPGAPPQSVLPLPPGVEPRGADPRFTRASTLPPAPQMPPMTDYERRGYVMSQQFPGDPVMQERAKQLIDYGQKLRADAHARDIEVWKSKVQLHEKEALAEQEYARKLPELTQKMDSERLTQQEKHLENQKRAAELAQQEQTRRHTEQLGGLTPQQYVQDVINPSVKKVESVPTVVNGIATARRMMDAGIYSGASANIEMSRDRLKASVGMTADPRIANTQAFMSSFGPMIASMRQAIAGGANISDKDVALAERLSGGDPTLERKAIEDILAATEKANLFNAVQHQKKLARFAGNDPARVDTTFNSFGLPMERLVPQSAVSRLRTAVEAAGGDPAKVQAELLEFDQDFATPGLAKRLLMRR